ncbi:hypothetical protein [Flavobacterium sp.]|uniref:hypothetical protein n=1 Tax=Flavobacterium sp. TaxID=239 RepID=UPI0026105427|nr:hypothetical protein [Flavobacterium sp.]
MVFSALSLTRAFTVTILIFVMILSGCSGSDDSAPNFGISSFSAVQDGAKLNIQYTTFGNVSAANLRNVYPGGEEIFLTTLTGSASLSLESLNLQGGEMVTLLLYAVSSSGTRESEPSNAVTIIIEPYCDEPYDLRTEAGYFRWDSFIPDGTGFYQVQYGTQGFNLGSGTIFTVNSTSTNDFTFQAGQFYDLYVRSFCSNSQAYSDWIGPLTYYSPSNQNFCTAPVNVGYSVVTNFAGEPVGAEFTWSDPGNSNNYEYNLVGNNQSPTSNAIEQGTSETVTYLSLVQNTEYDFYVRTRCTNGTATAWVGPINVNIGN